MNELKFPPLPKRSTCGRRSADVSCPISSTLSCQKIRTPTSSSAAAAVECPFRWTKRKEGRNTLELTDRCS